MQQIPAGVMKRTARVACSLLFVVAGIYHFAKPDLFARAIPDWLPQAHVLVLFTGVCEIAGALGLQIARWRLLTAKCLAVFLVCVFVANIHMALHPELFPAIAPWILVARLPLQFLLIWLVLWSAGDQK